MEFSRPRPSILSLFDPLSLAELDRADSDKENDFLDTSDFFKPSGTLKHIHVPPRTLKRRLVDVGDITVEPNMDALLSDEVEQEISYIVDDDENDTLTFRDMAEAATPKWSSRHATGLETPKVSPPRNPLAEILLKDELTPLARKKLYRHQPVFTTPKGSEPARLILPPSISSDNSLGCPEVRVNDEPVPQSSSESSFPLTLNQSMPAETLVTGTSLVAPAPCPAQPRTRHLSPTSPADNTNRYSVDLQTSFQLHFPSHDTTFDLLKDKISFFSSRKEFDSFFNDLEGDTSLDVDISIPEPGGNDSRVSSPTVAKSDKRLIDHPTPLSKDVGITEPSMASHIHVDKLFISDQISTMPSLIDDTKASQTVQPRVFYPRLVADSSRPVSTPSSSDVNRHPPPQIPALRIVKRSKTITQQKPSIMTKVGPPQDVLMSVGSRVPPVAEAPASSSLTTITKKGPSETSEVRRTDKAHLPSLHGSNGPRRVPISEGPTLNNNNLAPNARASEQGKPSSTCGPRRVAIVPERTSSSARPPVQLSSGLRKPVKYGTSAVKPVQRTAGSRLPAITRRIERKANLEQFDLKTICPSLHDDPAFSADPHSNPYAVTSHNSWLSVLKNNKIPLAPHGIAADSDSDLQPVQPPNSPDIPSGPSPQYLNPLTIYNKLPTLLSTLSSSANQGPTSVMSQGVRRSSVLKKENKQTSFLSRRQSAQPQSTKSFFLSIGKKVRRRSDLPAALGNTTLPLQPPQPTEDLPGSASVAPQKVLGNRGWADLDQIDQLDETNPWGIRIHHDGPYEAANIQVNKRAGHVPLGLASRNERYNTLGLQANYQAYIPPQVPTGVSLNLSPGQILPRQFLQPARMSSTIHGPYTPHFPAGPLLTPPNQPQYTATVPDVTNSGSQVRDDLPPIRETDNISSIIGMAMLDLTDNVPVPSSSAFLSQPGLADEQDFAPHDHVNQSEHRRVWSPLVSTQPEPSRGQASQSFQNASSVDTSSNKLEHLQDNSSPPTYKEHTSDEKPSNETPLEEQRHFRSSFEKSQNSLTFQNVELLPGAEPNDSRNASFPPPDRNVSPPQVVTRDQRVEVVQGTQYTSPALFLHPHRDGYRNEPDAQSTHYSTSVYSSSQFQSGGKPPPRHLPKRLVMPSPLNTGPGPPPNTAASLHDGRVPRSRTSYVNVERTHFQATQSHPPVAPIHNHGNTRVEDTPTLGGRKLRKKMSVILTPTPAPVITTVSFAPPIIGFHQNNEKGIAQSKTEDKPKRLLSKRKT